MNKKKYFIAEDGEQKGPFSINELKEMSISKTTLIWKEGLDDWTEAGRIEKLQISLKSTPPKLPENLQKKTKNEKTLNVNLGLGKTKSKIELKEKELAQEKIKTSVAKNTVYFINRILISILIIIAYYLIDDYFRSLTPQYENGIELDEYQRISANLEIVFMIILFVCFFIIFGKPISRIFGWFNKYSQKEI